MKIEQKSFSNQTGWLKSGGAAFDAASCNLVMAFGSTALLEDSSFYSTIRNNYPKAIIMMNSTAGEILNTQVYDDSIALTAIHFEKTPLKTSVIQIEDMKNSREAGMSLALGLDKSGLKSVLVISDGQKANGSDLVKGLQEYLPEDVIVTGGLAGDGSRFQKTLVGLNETPIEGRIVAIGFYGDNINISFGTGGGWDSFGPERLITKASANILFELDGKPALDVYKLYLGEFAAELPGSGLLFPLCIRNTNTGELIVRTILGVNEKDKSLVFAGNMPEGTYARLMKANLDRLIDGASLAATSSSGSIKNKPTLALLISCVGRKLVLDQRIEEEIEVIRNILGTDTAITGFYSYGEISPSYNFADCELHNQTMTITTFSENE